MKVRWLALTAGAWLASCAAVLAFDTVKTLSGSVAGDIIKMSPVEVTVKQPALERKVPVNEIQSILYSDEPSSLNLARTQLNGGRYQDALDTLSDPKKIDLGQIERAVIKQDVEFFKAMCAAKLALGGSGEIKAAGKVLFEFLKNNEGSYHFLEANELMGDLLVADGKFADAEPYYAKLGDAPWPDYKMRSGVAIGRLQLAQKQVDAAEKTFDRVLAIQAEGAQADFQRLNAKLGKARCMAEKNQAAEAKKMVEEIIEAADPEYQDLHARAYNTLGTIERKSGRTIAAALAFLHVDKLYFSDPEQHAEALANLEPLWNELHKPERAMKARQLLDTRYKNSPWAQKKGG